MFMRSRWVPIAIFAALPHVFACAGDDKPAESDPDAGANAENDAGTNVVPDAGEMPDTGPRPGLPVLGYETHSAAEVVIDVLGGGMNVPRDLAFNPDRPDELWVVNRADDSTTTFIGVGTADMTVEKRIDPFALHFMEEPSSLAFGAPGMFATCQESRNTYNGQAMPNDFMGPALWSSDWDVYAKSNPEAVAAIGYDLGSHLDMLHESPLCMGIAWEANNVYWTFDGMTGSISRYDFQADHGPGYDDHSDGIISRYVEGQVARVADVPSHLVLDHETRLLYIADTGNARIAVLDTTQGTRDRVLFAKEPGTDLHTMKDVSTTTLVDAAGGELMLPSGIALFGELLFVTDNATSRITAFSKTTGARVDYLDLGIPAGSLMGIELDASGNIFVVDAVAGRVLKISAKE
jgi:DNA-binding beta-propeller fold protein YncE